VRHVATIAFIAFLPAAFLQARDDALQPPPLAHAPDDSARAMHVEGKLEERAGNLHRARELYSASEDAYRSLHAQAHPLVSQVRGDADIVWHKMKGEARSLDSLSPDQPPAP